MSGRIKKLIWVVILSIVGITPISIFHQNNSIVSILLLLTLSIGVKFGYKRDDIPFILVGAFGGTIVEIVLLKFDVYQYANPTFLDIPIWAPFAWGIGILLIKRFAEVFSSREDEKQRPI